MDDHSPCVDDENPPPLETVGGFTISPQSDLPFGKQFRMGLVEHTIYERAVEDGYNAGIKWHLQYRFDHGWCDPGMRDEEQFARLVTQFLLKGLNTYRAGLRKSSFIAGWAAMFLGLVQVVPDEEEAW